MVTPCAGWEVHTQLELELLATSTKLETDNETSDDFLPAPMTVSTLHQ